jgi:hypothetical protein
MMRISRLWGGIAEDLMERTGKFGAGNFIGSLETTASQNFQLSERYPVGRPQFG